MSSRKSSSKPLPKFDIGEDYQLLYALGQGAYGTVAAGIYKPTGRQVAIKRILPFDHTLCCLRTLRELKLLKFFSESCVNENIITVLDIVKPASLESFKEIYCSSRNSCRPICTELSRTQHLTDDHCQYFIYQTLRALKTIHSADIVHRDLKPANLLLNANCDLKICDFGLARSIKTTAPTAKGQGGYDRAVDLWAVGCILAELISGRPLFPGRDYSHQLDLVLDVIGTPTLDEFYAITSRRSREYIRSLPIRRKRSFASLFPHASADAIDFLQKTLTFDPKKRMTVEEALEHPYVAAYHDADDEPAAESVSPEYFQFDLDKEQLSKDDLKKLLYDEVMSFQPIINNPTA
ncbi:putative MAP kinase [Gymnopus androsaceus JB14]|uniref:Mitogen-activated protein kinase n=1 Tax=Gymnopus androsaceus JB14 TaxID=1447944 RepID=A0A6A4HWT7_9AGAR|nr:putative MAP kinase [Gymnopus androsaceus JB14]